MLLPTIIKDKDKVNLPYITYKGNKFNRHDSNNKEASFIQVMTYKDTIKYHCIRNSIWDVFNVQNPQYPTKKFGIFSQVGVFNLEKMKSYIEELQKLGTRTLFMPYNGVGSTCVNTSMSV